MKQVTNHQIWDIDVFWLDLSCSTSNPSFEQKYSSCWQELKSRHNDIALMSIYMTDTFCSFCEKCHFQELFPFVSVGQYRPIRTSVHPCMRIYVYIHYQTLDVLPCGTALTYWGVQGVQVTPLCLRIVPVFVMIVYSKNLLSILFLHFVYHSAIMSHEFKLYIPVSDILIWVISENYI